MLSTAGADGLIVPRIETPEQAMKLVSFAKYPPMGVRGCGGTAFFDYKAPQLGRGACPWLNEQTLICPQVESVRAIEALDEILDVPGVDVIVVGPQDLSISLGVPGQHNHPRKSPPSSALSPPARRTTSPAASSWATATWPSPG